MLSQDAQSGRSAQVVASTEASRGASRRLENGFKGACRGLEGEGLEGALKEGFEKVLKGASR